ncbi:MAG: hypothetical protein IT446_09775 [Phycisphaerales bacterium]|nr:hypothetical protein [Phycisphaerales bacterium]
MWFSPGEFLTAMVGAGALFFAWRLWVRAERRRRLRALAERMGMHFCPADRFRIGPRLPPLLDCVGAADVRVYDVIYGVESERYRYVFAAEFTCGVVYTKRRCRRIVGMIETKDGPSGGSVSVRIADGQQSLIDQYQAAAQAPNPAGC